MLKALNCVPNVSWTSCAPEAMPDEGKFVWVVVGRIVESGEAKRYIREVALGVYQGDRRFQLFPYRMPMCSYQVWAWAPMTPPNPPVCSKNTPDEPTYQPEPDDD